MAVCETEKDVLELVDTEEMENMEDDVGKGRVIVKKGRESYRINHPKLAKVLEYAYGLYRDIKSIEPSYQDYKTYISEQAREHTDGTVSFIPEGADWACKITLGWECVVLPDKVEMLKNILGDRFDDLVKTKITYNGTQKLIELAVDGDRGQDIANCIAIKEKAPVVRWEEK